MKILIIGSNGQVGQALVKKLSSHNLIPINRGDCDLTNTNKIKHIIDRHKPDLIINSAAYTKVDQSEGERDIAFQINCDAPKVMALKACEYDIPFIHFSTDYVFDGMKKEPYNENDQTNPLGVYGQSKLAGDKSIQDLGGQFYIFRTSWVYSNVGPNFYLTIKRLIDENSQLKIVSDQKGVPTSSMFIATQIQKIIILLSHDNTGIYNLVPDGNCSWYDFAREIIVKTKSSFDINPLVAIRKLK